MFSASACATTGTVRTATRAPNSAAQRRHVVGAAFHIVGRPDGSGDAYDATLLFDRATAAVRENHCDRAVPDFDRLIHEFPDSRLVPLAYFNRGLCLQAERRHDDAIASYREAVARTPERTLHRDAWFRVAVVGETARRPELVVEATRAILALPALSIVDRVEAYARQAVALLAQSDRPGATHAAAQASQLAPTTESVRALEDDTFIAQARFVVAEVTRLDASDIAIRVDDPQLEQRVERRVQLVIHSHVQFNDAIRVGNPDWAAASGFRLGEMYRDLFNSIVHAETPTDWGPSAVATYRHRAAGRLRSLLTAALQAWEATLAMARRNGIADNDWVRRADHEIDELRQMILNDGTPPTGT